MPDTKCSLGTKDQVQASNLCANCQQAPGLGTILLWPQFLASGQRGRHQVEGEGRGTVTHCSVALWRKTDPIIMQQDLLRKTERA